ncbi:FAM172 family protein homolog CG10038 isoform X2 [Cloeon dipterum]
MDQTLPVDHCQPGNDGDAPNSNSASYCVLMTSNDQSDPTRPQVPCTDKSLPPVQNNGFRNQRFPGQAATDKKSNPNFAPAGQTQTPNSNEKSQSWISMKNIPEPEKFPSTLEEFGYKFNEDGALKKIIDKKTGKTGTENFEFNVSKDQRFNQNRYEALGKVVDEHVYKLMEEAGLKKFPVPFDAKESEPQTFVFATPDFLKTSADKNLLILIHGSGVVRAGQWARRLIINDCLDSGTQLPYIKKAMELGYNVLVLNTNDNKRETLIRGSKNPVEHALHVWDNYVAKPKSAKVAIVAHSFGGVCTSILAQERREEFAEKVFAVAFTDSVHDILRGEDFKHLRNVGRNWCASNVPLDEIIEGMSSSDMTTVSAGHTVHEWTSYAAFESVFKYIEEKRA